MIEPLQPVSTEDVAAHYDDLGRYYLELWGEHVHHGLWVSGNESPDEAVRALSELVMQKAEPSPGMHMVDVGCGYGGTARLLAGRGAHVTGYTLSAAQAEEAQRRSPDRDNPRYIVGDFLLNDLETASCGAAIAIESTEHFQDKQRLFGELGRLVKPGGRVVVCAWIANSAAPRWQVAHLLEPICREGRLPGMGSEADYQRLFAGTGMTLLDTQDVSRQVQQTWPRIMARIGRLALRRPSELRRFAGQRNRIFLLTVLRIWCAYATGAMRYLVFTAERR